MELVPLIVPVLTLVNNICQWLQSNNKDKKKKELHELEKKLNNLERTLNDLKNYKGHSSPFKNTLNDCSETLKEIKNYLNSKKIGR
ncbi:2138_t:CDS:1, partial [Dentiscutata heterogama]